MYFSIIDQIKIEGVVDRVYQAGTVINVIHRKHRNRRGGTAVRDVRISHDARSETRPLIGPSPPLPP